MASVFECFDEYILAVPDDFRFHADPDYVDVAFSLTLLEPLGLEAAREILLPPLATRNWLLTHLTIPECYEALRYVGVSEIFQSHREFADDYFEVELNRLSLGSVEIELHIKLSSKGKKAAKEHPSRFLRALSCFISGIALWSGLITISGAQGQPISVPPPPQNVINICHEFAPVPYVTAANIELEAKSESGATICTIQLTGRPP